MRRLIFWAIIRAVLDPCSFLQLVARVEYALICFCPITFYQQNASSPLYCALCTRNLALAGILLSDDSCQPLLSPCHIPTVQRTLTVIIILFYSYMNSDELHRALEEMLWAQSFKSTAPRPSCLPAWLIFFHTRPFNRHQLASLPSWFRTTH